MNTRRSRTNPNERSLDKYLETNDKNWYKLCSKKIRFKQLSFDYVIKKDKYEQIRLEGM